MSNQNQVILEQLQSLTSREVSELVGELETAFDVDVSSTAMRSPWIFQMDSTEEGIEPIEERSLFDVMLEIFPAERKIQVLKVVRSLTGLNLRASKELIESAPAIICSDLSFDAAAEIKEQLEAAGAIVSLR